MNSYRYDFWNHWNVHVLYETSSASVLAVAIDLSFGLIHSFKTDLTIDLFQRAFDLIISTISVFPYIDSDIGQWFDDQNNRIFFGQAGFLFSDKFMRVMVLVTRFFENYFLQDANFKLI